MTTPVQNFDLYDLGGSTAADMYDDDIANPPISSELLTAVIKQIIDDNVEPIEAMDFTYAPHREYLAGTIAHAMLDVADIHITTTNTSEDK